MRHFIAATIFSLASTIAGALMAEDQPVLVELFTSQGCSSCPPADAILHELADRDDVIALALHVDYWDYIGWKDEFARPEHTNRQRAYVRRFGTRPLSTIVAGCCTSVPERPTRPRHLTAVMRW